MKKLLTFLITVLIVFNSVLSFSAVSKPLKPKGLKIVSYNHMYHTVSLNLKEKKTANYQVKVYNYKNKLSQTINLSPNRSFTGKYNKRFPYVIKNIKDNRFYKIKVRSYKKSNGKKIYGKYSKPVYACQEVNCSLDWNTHAISWDKVKGASRYIVKLAKDNGSKKFVKFATVKDTNVVLTDSVYKEYGKRFYAQIIAQKKVKNKYYSSHFDGTFLWHM